MIERVKFKMKLIRNLQDKGFDIQKGLTVAEIDIIENIYDIYFPIELKKYYMAFLPVKGGFYNWRDFSNKNMEFIKKSILTPIEGLLNNTNDIEWNDLWGKEPPNCIQREKFIKEKLNKAPKPIPIYSHRYIISTKDKTSPVFSIVGTDVICYGENLKKYFEIEFMDKSYKDIQFNKIKNAMFWNEII